MVWLRLFRGLIAAIFVNVAFGRALVFPISFRLNYLLRGRGMLLCAVSQTSQFEKQ